MSIFEGSLVKSLVMLCRPGAHIRDFHAHNPTSERGNNKNISTDPLLTLFVITEMLSTQLFQKKAQGFFHDGTGTRNVQILSSRALGRVTRELQMLIDRLKLKPTESVLDVMMSPHQIKFNFTCLCWKHWARCLDCRLPPPRAGP